MDATPELAQLIHAKEENVKIEKLFAISQFHKTSAVRIVIGNWDKPGTLELRELSLALNTPDGMVIVAGCSHPGFDKNADTAAEINPRIQLVAGGFHLVVSKDEEIEKIVSGLLGTYKVAYVAPDTHRRS
jgi:metal-dependent hydrolase (beta-lactamase superfamily II)